MWSTTIRLNQACPTYVTLERSRKEHKPSPTSDNCRFRISATLGWSIWPFERLEQAWSHRSHKESPCRYVALLNLTERRRSLSNRLQLQDTTTKKRWKRLWSSLAKILKAPTGTDSTTGQQTQKQQPSVKFDYVQNCCCNDNLWTWGNASLEKNIELVKEKQGELSFCKAGDSTVFKLNVTQGRYKQRHGCTVGCHDHLQHKPKTKHFIKFQRV